MKSAKSGNAFWPVLLLGVCVAGCGRATSPPPGAAAAESSTPAQAVPAAPEPDEGLEGAASPVLVQPLDPDQKRPDQWYTKDDTLATGSLLGLCYVPAKKPLTLTAPPRVDIASGPDAISKPEKEELRYYGKITLRRPAWLHAFNPGQGGHPVTGAALIVRGIKKGRREPMTRGGFQVNNGAMRPVIGFTPLDDRAEVRTLDAFSNDLVLTDLSDGRAIWTQVLAGNTATFGGHGALDKEHLISWSRTQWLKLAKPVQSPPLRSMGFYKLTCKRHPWQAAYLVVVDNPYVAVPASRHRGRGVFTIGQIPVGVWMLEVWHPVLEPVERTIPIEIKADETLELPVAFKVPAGLK